MAFPWDSPLQASPGWTFWKKTHTVICSRPGPWVRNVEFWVLEPRQPAASNTLTHSWAAASACLTTSFWGVSSSSQNRFCHLIPTFAVSTWLPVIGQNFSLLERWGASASYKQLGENTAVAKTRTAVPPPLMGTGESGVGSSVWVMPGTSPRPLHLTMGEVACDRVSNPDPSFCDWEYHSGFTGLQEQTVSQNLILKLSSRLVTCVHSRWLLIDFELVAVKPSCLSTPVHSHIYCTTLTPSFLQHQKFYLRDALSFRKAQSSSRHSKVKSQCAINTPNAEIHHLGCSLEPPREFKTNTDAQVTPQTK